MAQEAGGAPDEMVLCRLCEEQVLHSSLKLHTAICRAKHAKRKEDEALNKEVADLYNACDPAVLRLLHQSLKVAAAAGVPANVCGQMSGSVMFTQLLLGLGLRHLSVPASAIPEVKQLCRSVSEAECRGIAQRALEMDSAREIKAFLRDQLRRVLAQTVA